MLNLVILCQAVLEIYDCLTLLWTTTTTTTPAEGPYDKTRWYPGRGTKIGHWFDPSSIVSSSICFSNARNLLFSVILNSFCFVLSFSSVVLYSFHWFPDCVNVLFNFSFIRKNQQIVIYSNIDASRDSGILEISSELLWYSDMVNPDENYVLTFGIFIQACLSTSRDTGISCLVCGHFGFSFSGFSWQCWF